jgi:hypothetical protein
MTMMESLDQLRGRFMRLRGNRSWRAIAPSVGVDYAVLRRFSQGGPAKASTLTKVEAWCDRQERVAEQEALCD